MSQDHQALKNYMETIQPMPEDEWKNFSSLFTPFTVRRKEILTSSGGPERYLYFVLEGCQRVYFQNEDGKEATLVFTYAPSFGGVLDAMLSGQPSRYHYETLTESRLLRAPFKGISELRNVSPSLDKLIYNSLSATISGLLQRMAELQCYSSEEKFRALLKRSPQILKQVPHKYLANYLGIDPTNFSKFINRIIV